LRSVPEIAFQTDSNLIRHIFWIWW
jgi:hypothetical protein